MDYVILHIKATIFNVKITSELDKKSRSQELLECLSEMKVKKILSIWMKPCSSQSASSNVDIEFMFQDMSLHFQD